MFLTTLVSGPVNTTAPITQSVLRSLLPLRFATAAAAAQTRRQANRPAGAGRGAGHRHEQQAAARLAWRSLGLQCTMGVRALRPMQLPCSCCTMHATFLSLLGPPARLPSAFAHFIT
jgi:hypothetical protein